MSGKEPEKDDVRLEDRIYMLVWPVNEPLMRYHGFEKRVNGHLRLEGNDE